VAITILVGIAGLIGVFNGFLSIGQRSNAEDLLAGRISDTEFRDELLGTSAFGALTAVTTIAAMVVVMIWMYRITSNLRAFGTDTTWHPLFAVFGWFLPPLVLYIIPGLMLREQWAKSAPSTFAGQTASNTSTSTSGGENPALGVWWLAFGIWPLVPLLLSAGSFLDSFGETDPEVVAQDILDVSPTLTLIGSVVGLVAAVAWIFFVRQLTARHRSLTGER